MQLIPTAPDTAAPRAGASLRLALAAATAALLAPATGAAQGNTSAPAAPASAAPARVPWQVDSAVLVYKEGGGRVGAVEPVISLRRTDGNDRSIGLKITLDALTGASPNGAAPQPVPQTFTSPSGERDYTVGAGQTPLDTSFRDQRAALAFSLEQPWGEAQRVSLGANLSTEYDFNSLSVNAALARDFNQKNTTLSLGLALEADRMKPVGGTPVGLRPAFGALSERQGNGSRNVFDILAGVTQVMNRQWLMQVNLGVGRGSGDHNDPYKILSVVDGNTGLVVGDRYVSELRPDQRTRASLYWQNKVHLARDVVDFSYRYYGDSWGVRAHTLDLRYRLELGGGLYLEPHARLHRQGAADFWRGWLVEGRDWNSATHRATVAEASADPRLAAFTAQTLGLGFGMPVGRGSELTLRAEFYRQQPKRPADAPGALQTLDLAPTLKATTLLVGYSFAF